MFETKNYEIFCCVSLEDLVTLVNAKIDDGYIPVGGYIHTPECSRKFTQTMIKKDITPPSYNTNPDH